jgi:hypothetical protein
VIEISRRRFLGLSLLTGLLDACGKIFHTSPLSVSVTPAYSETLAAYLDTLIPADGTPGAVQLGVAEKIIAEAARDSSYRQRIDQGCGWLDQQAVKYGASHFAALSEAQREEVVDLAAGGQAGLMPLIFFDRTRDDAFFYYYAHPQSWPGLGYAGPPQPRGFMNYAEPPRRQG